LSWLEIVISEGKRGFFANFGQHLTQFLQTFFVRKTPSIQNRGQTIMSLAVLSLFDSNMIQTNLSVNRGFFTSEKANNLPLVQVV